MHHDDDDERYRRRASYHRGRVEGADWGCRGGDRGGVCLRIHGVRVLLQVYIWPFLNISQ